MHVVTDIFLKRHMVYLAKLENPLEELNKFETLFDHIYYFFTKVLEMPEAEAKKIVEDFKAHAEKAPAL